MKQLLFLSIFMAMVLISYAQTNANNIEKTYTSLFFKQKINELTLLRQYEGKYICPPSELDTLLSKDNYRLSRNYVTAAYKK